MIRDLGVTTAIEVDRSLVLDQTALQEYVFVVIRCGTAEIIASDSRETVESWIAAKPEQDVRKRRTAPKYFRDVWVPKLDLTTPTYLGVSAIASNDVWIWQGRIYGVDVGMEQSEQEILVRDKAISKAKRIERARARVALDTDSGNRSSKRERISDEVKTAVWRRDSGVCINCGSNRELEFDHIIPLAMGGSNTFRNLQLLCAGCNRDKGPNLF